MGFDDPLFWLAALQIIWLNVLLSGDNAVVIAMACRTLPPRRQRIGMVLGAGAAVVLRIVFTAVVARVMMLPFLKLLGGGALLWIAVKLLAGEDGQSGDSIDAPESLWRAIWIVVVADIVMSLDNVIAIAAAAKGNLLLIVFGLAVSVPMVVAGSALLMAVLSRLPVLVWAGAALLGWVAGEIASDDAVLTAWIGTAPDHRLSYVAAGLGALLVVGAGMVMNRRRAQTPLQGE